MGKNKFLLISWTSHMFREVMVPIINKLYKDFNIVLIVVDFHISDELLNDFKDYKKKQIIKYYFIIPPYSQVKDQFRYLKDNTELLKSYDFDYWLTPSEMQLDDKYISEFVIPKKCFVIVFAHTVTYLFDRIEILNRLIPEDLLLLEYNKNNSDIKKKSTKNRSKKIIGYDLIKNKLMEIEYRHLSLLYSYCKNKLGKKIKILIGNYFYRIIIPWFQFGKTFGFGPFDQLTQIGSGKSDLFLFTDPLEVKAHQKLFQKQEIIPIQYPTYGNCWCTGPKLKKKNILIMLGGVFMSNAVSEEAITLFLRDSKIVFNETKPDCFHLRLHPRMTSNSPKKLRDILVKNGIPTEITTPNKTIREIMCNYIGVAGLCSNGLRDARAACDFVFVVAFEAVSKYRYTEPKILYGMGEGISWINENGSYDPLIFKRKKYVPPKRKSVPEIINELAGNQNLVNSL